MSGLAIFRFYFCPSDTTISFQRPSRFKADFHVDPLPPPRNSDTRIALFVRHVTRIGFFAAGGRAGGPSRRAGGRAGGRAGERTDDGLR